MVATLTDAARVLVVDDHPIVRHGLALLISSQPDLDLIGEAETPQAAVEMFRELQPDLMLLDLSLKEGSGLDVLKVLRSEFPDARVLVASMHDDELYAERALHAGAMGYINKREPAGRLLDAIRQVLRGQVVLNQPIADRLLRRSQGRASEPAAEPLPVARLSDRELEVFELLGQGLTSAEVASRLGIRQKTVETFREKIKRKLELSNSNQLIQHAVQWVLQQR